MTALTTSACPKPNTAYIGKAAGTWATGCAGGVQSGAAAANGQTVLSLRPSGWCGRRCSGATRCIPSMEQMTSPGLPPESEGIQPAGTRPRPSSAVSNSTVARCLMPAARMVSPQHHAKAKRPQHRGQDVAPASPRKTVWHEMSTWTNVHQPTKRERMSAWTNVHRPTKRCVAPLPYIGECWSSHPFFKLF